MKTRLGFVSNSSSSSFMIRLHKLTEEQIQQILEPNYATQKYGGEDDEGRLSYAWSINVNQEGNRIDGYTSMDNFSMREYLGDIGVPSDIVRWED